MVAYGALFGTPLFRCPFEPRRLAFDIFSDRARAKNSAILPEKAGCVFVGLHGGCLSSFHDADCVLVSIVYCVRCMQKEKRFSPKKFMIFCPSSWRREPFGILASATMELFSFLCQRVRAPKIMSLYCRCLETSHI